eukprot:GHVS01076934.1.p1 GENE.GHVS01076934.1~~GHVS01076934.1.p1  ORF type:complete len:188 (+),score=33.82 GHVS01076934.1:238-801(+)
MEAYASYPPSSPEQQQQQNAYMPATGQPEAQTQVGPEWGQQFVDNFFQTQPPTQGGQQIYTSGEYVNTPTNMNYNGTSPPSNQQAYYTAAASATPMDQPQQVAGQGIYQQTANGAYAQAYANPAGYSAGYYEPTRSIQHPPPAYGVPQFQAPQYNSYAPQGGSQVYMMPPVVKKTSSHKKKKQGMCC